MIQDRLTARAFWEAVRKLRRDRRVAPAEAEAVHSVELTRALARLDTIRDQCRALVTRRAALSAGAAVVPLPVFDVGADVAILVKLLPAINERFGLTPAQIDALDAETKRVVMMFISGVGSSLIGKLISRELVVKVLMKLGARVTTKGIVKFVPLLGQAISASISFGAMKLLGNQHIDDCHAVAKRTLLASAGMIDSNAPPTETKWELVR